MCPGRSGRAAVTARSRSYSLKIWSPGAIGIGLVALACTPNVPVVRLAGSIGPRRRAARVERREPAGVEGDGGDLLAAVQGLRVESETDGMGTAGVAGQTGDGEA